MEFKTLIDHCDESIFIFDNNGKVIFINETALRRLGGKKSWLLEKELKSLMPEVFAQVQKSISNHIFFKKRFIKEKNRNLWVTIYSIDIDNEKPGIACHLWDAGAMENNNREIVFYQQLNKRLNAIINTSSDGIWVCDNKGTVISINKASERLNNINAKDILGKPASYLVSKGFMDCNVTYEVIQKRQQISKMQHIKKAGTHLLVTGTPAFDEDGNIFLVVLNERDLTELIDLSEKLQQSEMVAEKIKDELAAMQTVASKSNELIAESSSMREILNMAFKLSRINADSVLITGESGTGKGLLANYIHQNSRRKQNPFMQINCAALPENLLEAELFGYEKGAFTGAREQGKIGLIELAQGGTLFLDEIGELPVQVQAKLLKYLDDKKVLRLGGTRQHKINCNIIAATNRDLESMVLEKTFRQDLYYRLNTFPIHIPPLRKRHEDLIEITQRFLKEYNHIYREKKKITVKGINRLQDYHFPGNVRELKNIIKNAVVMSGVMCIDDYLKDYLSANPTRFNDSKSVPVLQRLDTALEQTERQLLQAAVTHCRSTRHIANVLGVSQPTVVRKLKKHLLQTK